MTMPTPPPVAPATGPEPTGQQQPPAAPPAPVNAPPAAPPTPAPVPTPPTWTPPPPAHVDDGGIDDISKLPKKWQKELSEARGDAAKYRVQARTETVIRHAYTTAAQHGANPEALLGSVAFQTAAAQLDPSSPEFPAQLAEAIRATLTANPWMAAQGAPAPPAPPPVPPVSGGDFTGSGSAGPTLDQQIAEAEKAGNHMLAIALKRQLARPPQ